MRKEPSNLRPRILGEAPSGTFSTKKENGELANPGEAIFPILTQLPDKTFQLVGTGFFIGQEGLFVTAAHNILAVLDANGVPKLPVGIFQFLPGNQYLKRPIQLAVRHRVADIAVGIAGAAIHSQTGKTAPNLKLALTLAPPKIGSEIFTYAYPLTEVRPGSPQEIHFAPRFFQGTLVAHHPNGRDRVMLPGPCFQTSMAVHGGASGGPVLGPDGKVFAVNSTGYENEAMSFVSCISAIFDVEFPSVKLPTEAEARPVSIRELTKLGYISAS